MTTIKTMIQESTQQAQNQQVIIRNGSSLRNMPIIGLTITNIVDFGRRGIYGRVKFEKETLAPYYERLGIVAPWEYGYECDEAYLVNLECHPVVKTGENTWEIQN